MNGGVPGIRFKTWTSPALVCSFMLNGRANVSPVSWSSTGCSAPSCTSAVASRSMFSGAWSGTRSISRVARTTPCAPTARPPTITYRTPALFNDATTRSGSNRSSALTSTVGKPKRRAAGFDGQAQPLSRG